MDLDKLAALLDTLRENGVLEYENEGVALKLHPLALFPNGLPGMPDGRELTERELLFRHEPKKRPEVDQ